MLTADQLTWLVRHVYPSLPEHGRGWLCVMEVDEDGRQITDAFIAMWHVKDTQKPDASMLRTEWGKPATQSAWHAYLHDRTVDDARWERDKRLGDIDLVTSNPLRWQTMTADQKQAWSDYRQALLDVPQQSGFPETINWPTQPR